MTCVWLGLIRGLGHDTIKQVLQIDVINPTTFAKALRGHARIPASMQWNDEAFTHNQLQDVFDNIKNIDIHNIQNGHLVGACDPMLAGIADLFDIEVHHVFLGRLYIFKKPNYTPRFVLKFTSSSGHFEFSSRVDRSKATIQKTTIPPTQSTTITATTKPTPKRKQISSASRARANALSFGIP